MDTDDKTVRDASAFARSLTHIEATLSDEVHGRARRMTSTECVDKLQKKIVRRWLRETASALTAAGMEEDPSAGCRGSAFCRAYTVPVMFTRGQTQVLTICTLGPVSGDAQELDGILTRRRKSAISTTTTSRPYSVGETQAVPRPRPS